MNKDLIDGEIKILILKSETLAKVSCKSMKIKIEDNDRVEQCGSYVDPKHAANQDGITTELNVPAKIFKDLKNYKGIIAIKKAKMIFGEENIFKEEVPINDF